MVKLISEFLIAIDTVVSDEEDELLLIPDCLIKFMRKYGEKINLRFMIYHKKQQKLLNFLNPRLLNNFHRELIYLTLSQAFYLIWVFRLERELIFYCTDIIKMLMKT